MGQDEFSGLSDQLKSCRQWWELSKYAISENFLQPFLRKSPKTSFFALFWHKIADEKNLGPKSKIGLDYSFLFIMK